MRISVVRVDIVLGTGVRVRYQVRVPLETLLPVAAVLLALLLVIAWFSPRSPWFRRITGAIYLILTLALVAYPWFVTLYHLLSDDGLRSAGPSKFAFSLHQSLSEKLPGYIEGRIASNAASSLKVSQITATESPVYGAFFYLQATERLQRQWQADPARARRAPAVTGARAIEASLRIMLDEGHAHWMRTYWGDDFMGQPQCFYRMLLIGCLASHHSLTGIREHLPLLKSVTDDLAADIDASPKGLIDDYPGQCFPCDVACAIAMIENAASVVGEDRHAWARQAFARMMESFPDGLPPYMAAASSGKAVGPCRGSTNGFFFSYSAQLAPAQSPAWYQEYAARFWQGNRFVAGWREFSNNERHPAYYMDPDSGPVIGGLGTGATGLGLGCARVHGDHRRAGILGAEMIAASIPLPGGTLLVPRLVSDRTHAPYFAEQVILHQLSMLPTPALTTAARAPLPLAVWMILALETLLLGLLLRLSAHLLLPARLGPPPGCAPGVERGPSGLV